MNIWRSTVAGARVFVDIKAVRLVIDYICGCAERLEYRFCDIPRCAVGTVEPDALAAAGSGADAYMLHVTTTPSVAYITRVDEFDCGIMISASQEYIPKEIR